MYAGAFDWRENLDGLIRAYAGLPRSLRLKHQLALIGPDLIERPRLKSLALTIGLESEELVLPEYVSDDDLLILYNACSALVIPGLRESFDLPALEAMQCGKAVIAWNTSSMPEEVGRPDAPSNDAFITASLKRVMEDDVFRAELERNGPTEVAKFSWDKSARRAITATEGVLEKLELAKAQTGLSRRKRLAFVSPLPPERSGISDYSATLLPALHAFYEIDVIVDQRQVSGDWIAANCHQRGVEWFRSHFREYDRILYQFGNSPFHRHMLELIETAPGPIVLHDFFLSGLQADRGNEVFLHVLKESHGYRAVIERLSSPEAAVYKYPANLDVLQNSRGVIVHSEYSRVLANQWYGDGVGDDFAIVPLTHTVSEVNEAQREEARNRIGLPRDALLLCSFGFLSPTKLNDRLLSCFMTSRLADELRVYLLFVGENHGTPYGQKLSKTISESGMEDRIRISGWVDAETYRNYLQAVDIAIQLRGLSRGESSYTILDCMSYGVPTVINANGAMANIERDAVWMLDDLFENDELIEALEKLAQAPALRKKIGVKAQELIRTLHSPRHCAALYAQAIEGFYAKDSDGLGGLIGTLTATPLNGSDASVLASALSQNFPPKPRLRQLLVDVSTIAVEDLKTGIQRVVREILRHWLVNPPAGWSVEPVYASWGQPGYRYARRFACALLEINDTWAQDEPVDAWPDDKFVGLDWLGARTAVQQSVLEKWYRFGVDIRFVVYDLLPMHRQDFFPNGSADHHLDYLKCITRFNGAVCISRAVAGELREWCYEHGAPRSIPFAIDWFHLGADMSPSRASSGSREDATDLVEALRKAPTFLVVGTVEPRKGHRQVLAAMEILWAKGIQANLVIVGKQGWMVEDLVERVKRHPELSRQLFWPDNVADDYLEQIYSASTCLIAASEGEGFGLPLIEAAQRGLPIIARDLPVFREVAAEHAFYFNGLNPGDLAGALCRWLTLYETKSHVQSSGMNWLTWAQSAEMLLARLGIGTSTEDAKPRGHPVETRAR